MSTPFLGEVRLFGFDFAPIGWRACDGSLLGIAENEALFTLLGTTYGGDGQSTFGLPDLRGQVPLHHGSGPGLTPRTIGERGGSERVTLTVDQLGAHGHGFTATTTSAGSKTPSTSVMLGSVANDRLYTTAPDGSPHAMSQASTLPAGGSQSHDNLMPTLAVQFCIAVEGIFPSQG